MAATIPNRPEDREDPELVRTVDQRVREFDPDEPRRGDDALTDIQQRRKQLKHPVPR